LIASRQYFSHKERPVIAPAKQLSTLRQVSALVVVCTLFPTALAHAAIITRTAVFSGPEQTADVSIRANG
jgi:hypothetical protein